MNYLNTLIDTGEVTVKTENDLDALLRVVIEAGFLYSISYRPTNIILTITGGF